MQLRAMLESRRRFVELAGCTTIIQYAGDSRRPDIEADFRSDVQLWVEDVPDVDGERYGFGFTLLHLLQSLSSEYVTFGVDDSLYCAPVNFDWVAEKMAANTAVFGVSMRLPKSQPVWQVWETHQSCLGEHHCYPFEVCATVYRVADLLDYAVTPLIATATTPNRFEHDVCNFFARNNRGMGTVGICNVHLGLNRVQNEFENTTVTSDQWSAKQLTADVLRQRYDDGLRIDWEYFVEQEFTEPHVGCERLKFKYASQA